MPDEDKSLKTKPLSAAAQARATVLALIRPRVDHAYANPMRGPDDLPIHPNGGDNETITIPHEWIGLLYRLTPFKSKFGRSEEMRARVRDVDFQRGDDWAGLRALRSDLSCLSCVSREYSGALAKDICEALEGAQD